MEPFTNLADLQTERVKNSHKKPEMGKTSCQLLEEHKTNNFFSKTCVWTVKWKY
jgi:hypothetical protein